MVIDKAAAKLTYLGWLMAQSGRPEDTPSSGLFDRAAWRFSRARLDSHMRRDTIPAIVDSIETYRGLGAYAHMRALHHPAETIALATKVQQRRPKVIVEIGTCWGGSLFVWARSNAQADLIVSMDLPGGSFGGGYHANRIKMYQHFVSDRPGTKLELLRCDTHALQSREALLLLLNGRKIDFLFIDGDHSYDGVRQDFEMYSGLVRPGGLVAFHDINTLQSDHHVHRYWDGLKTQYESEEIVAERSNGTYGLGLLTLPQR